MKIEKQQIRCHCCEIECTKLAAYVLQGPGNYEDNTHVCYTHLEQFKREFGPSYEVIAIEYDIRVCMDGNAWGATFGNFVDLMQSPSGWGDTPWAAVQNLLDFSAKPRYNLREG